MRKQDHGDTASCHSEKSCKPLHLQHINALKLWTCSMQSKLGSRCILSLLSDLTCEFWETYSILYLVTCKPLENQTFKHLYAQLFGEVHVSPCLMQSMCQYRPRSNASHLLVHTSMPKCGISRTRERHVSFFQYRHC